MKVILSAIAAALLLVSSAVAASSNGSYRVTDGKIHMCVDDHGWSCRGWLVEMKNGCVYQIRFGSNQSIGLGLHDITTDMFESARDTIVRIVSPASAQWRALADRYARQALPNGPYCGTRH